MHACNKVLLIFLLLMTLESGCRSNPASSTAADPESGIPLALAMERAQNITGLTYDLSFSLPSVSSEPVTGKATIRFATKDTSRPVVLDFSPGADFLTSVSIGGKASGFRVTKDHIVIPSEEVTAGENIIEIV